MSDLLYIRYAEWTYGVRINQDSVQHINENTQNLLAMVTPALMQSAEVLNGFHTLLDISRAE